MTLHSFSTCGFCRLMLTVEQVVTAGHNTSVRNFLKYDFAVKGGNLFTVENVQFKFFTFLWLFW